MTKRFEINDTAMIPPDPDAGKVGRVYEIERSTYQWWYDLITIEYPGVLGRRTLYAYQLQGLEQPRDEEI